MDEPGFGSLDEPEKHQLGNDKKKKPINSRGKESGTEGGGGAKVGKRSWKIVGSCRDSVCQIFTFTKMRLNQTRHLSVRLVFSETATAAAFWRDGDRRWKVGRRASPRVVTAESDRVLPVDWSSRRPYFRHVTLQMVWDLVTRDLCPSEVLVTCPGGYPPPPAHDYYFIELCVECVM